MFVEQFAQGRLLALFYFDYSEPGIFIFVLDFEFRIIGIGFARVLNPDALERFADAVEFVSVEQIAAPLFFL